MEVLAIPCCQNTNGVGIMQAVPVMSTLPGCLRIVRSLGGTPLYQALYNLWQTDI